jgi:hypothetical protein
VKSVKKIYFEVSATIINRHRITSVGKNLLTSLTNFDCIQPRDGQVSDFLKEIKPGQVILSKREFSLRKYLLFLISIFHNISKLETKIEVPKTPICIYGFLT